MSFSLTVHCLKVSICSHPVGFCTTSPETGQAPKFDVPLEPVTVGEGEKLSLQCHVTGSTPITIQWMKDRRELVSSGNTKISFVGGTANLEISQVSKTYAGDYLCKASNANGTDFCKSKVTVKGNQSVVPVLCNEHILSLHCTVEKVYCSDAKPTLLQNFVFKVVL